MINLLSVTFFFLLPSFIVFFDYFINFSFVILAQVFFFRPKKKKQNEKPFIYKNIQFWNWWIQFWVLVYFKTLTENKNDDKKQII